MAEVYAIFFLSLSSVPGLIENCLFGSISENNKLREKTIGLGRDLSGCNSTPNPPTRNSLATVIIKYKCVLNVMIYCHDTCATLKFTLSF